MMSTCKVDSRLPGYHHVLSEIIIQADFSITKMSNMVCNVGLSGTQDCVLRIRRTCGGKHRDDVGEVKQLRRTSSSVGMASVC
jgi:hypothetical protein